jgi:hypothetical protein
MLAPYNLSRLFSSWHLWLSKLIELIKLIKFTANLIKLIKFTANLIRLSFQLNQLINQSAESTEQRLDRPLARPT